MNTNLLKQSIRLFAEASFSRSGGPGGQNVNKVSSKVTLKMRLEELDGLFEPELERVKTLLANRISKEGALIITSEEERSQRTNLERAYARMEALVIAAARLPKKRRPTKPSRAVKEARLKAKRKQAEKKALRVVSRETL